MSSSLKQLSSRQLECVKSELAEVIIANFCYPAFLDYRLNLLRTRPVDRRKRQEVWAYINSLNLGPLATMDAASMEFRRFVERVFLRYIDMNRLLIATASARQGTAVRARVPQLAASVARGLADYLALGEVSSFGRARSVESWTSTAQGYIEPTWEQIEKSTQLLQTTLVYLRVNGAGKAAPAAGGSQLDEGAIASISSYPTIVLNPLSSAHQPGPSETADGMASSPAHASFADESRNGVSNGRRQHAPAPLFVGQTPSGKRQLRGLDRSPTESRPLDEPPATLPASPAGAAPDAPEPSPAAIPAASAELPPPATQPVSVTQPQADAEPGAPPDVWQALLSTDAAEQASDRSGANAALAPFGLPGDDLPDLPESFGTQRALDLPPDLAELYGNYLRDSRTAKLDLSWLVSQEAAQAELPHETSAAPTAPAETDAEIDALFSTLSSQVAEMEEAESVAARDPSEAPVTPPERPPSGPVQPAQRVSAPLGMAGNAGLSVAQPVQSQSDRGLNKAPAASAKGGTDGDIMIFSQLYHQISTWVKMAAVSHQIDIADHDAAALVAELRRIAALEEAELQVIESLVAICQRVIATKQTTMDDYKQAMMLYLLHHRSRLAL